MIKTLLALCVVLAVCGNVFSQVPPFNETCESNKYPPSNSTIVPTYRVNLDLPAEQRWVTLSTIYKKEVRDLIAYIKVFVLEFSPKFQELINLIDNDLGSLAHTLPAPYGDEIKGIASATDLPLGEVVLYNIFYEIFTLCTSIIAFDENGNTMHGRNLDFGLFLGWDLKNDTWQLSELLRPLIVNVEYTRGGVVQYKTVTFVGFVGLITGVKPGVMSLSINERFGVYGGYIGIFEWILNINRNQSWITLIARDVLEKPDIDYDKAVDMLTNTPLLAPCYYIIAGAKSKQGAIITRSRVKADDVWILGSNNTWFIAETNYDHWEAPLFIDDRITPTNKCMNKLGQKDLSFEGIFNVLSSKPVLNKLTVYSSLMRASDGYTETYIQYCKTPCWPF